MFERFTERARKVMSLARQEAQRLNSEVIGTEHMLLGIIQEGGGVAAKVLQNLNLDLKRLRQQIEKLATPSTSPTVTLGQIPFSPASKEAIRLAEEQALQLGHDVIGTEHLLLGILKEENGVAGKVLADLGMKAPEIRDMVLEVLGADVGPPDGGDGTPPVLPDPMDVKKAMSDISRLVDDIGGRFAEFAKEYGIHGDPLKVGGLEFKITRFDEKWGVWLKRSPDETAYLITECRMNEKIEFLTVVRKMELLYRKQIVKVFNRAKGVLEKNAT